MFKKPDKKSLQYLSIVVVIAILVCVGFLYLIFKMPEEKKGEVVPEERTMEEIIRDLTAPEGKAGPVSEEMIEGLTAPESVEEASSLSEEVIKNLTAPE